ncbi:hypothetical protein HID58_086051 [Brassica napus]|uniref:Uncharacterized protein n=1 Tax=Brassica napus TaxID=3708 RepID=A0ABQ7XS80_BRANA|nr:PREDICTED: protein NEN2-like [Brassica oleracea var. oleracea]KAH0857790.1 hypothetical protein HID58_086051 [Brassica napus]
MKPHHHTPFDTFARYHHHQQLISTIRHLSLSLCAVFISELPAARCNLVQLKSLFLDNNQVKHVEQLKRGFADIADDVYEILHGRVWAGHNILRFDIPRIREAFADCRDWT